MSKIEDDRLQAIQNRRPPRPATERLGDNVLNFMKRVVEPRRKRMASLAVAWEELLPPELAQHTCLDGLNRGQLKVMVDSAPHLAELNILLREGFLDELRQACPSARVTRVKLERGQWYRENRHGIKIPTYR